MRAGSFNLKNYLEMLNEEANAESNAGNVKDGGLGIMIPDGESKKAYDWLKKEYNKSQTEVKVEMRMGGSRFEPAMKMQQTGNDSVKNFKAGIFGEIKTSDTEGAKKTEDYEKSDTKFKESSEEGPKEKEPKKKKDDANESGEGQTVKIDAKTKKKKEE